MQSPPREDLRLIDYEENLITLVSFVYAGLPGDALD
jgi:hypothetical protein